MRPFVLKGHAMRWSFPKQKYVCECGATTYDGGEHKARRQHRDHKNWVQAQQMLDEIHALGRERATR